MNRLSLAVISALALSTFTFASNLVKVEFKDISVPTTDKQKREVRATNQVNINGKKYKIGYHTILRSGQDVGDNIFGLIYDTDGKPITEKDGSLMISNSNDFSSLLPVGKKLFMVSHFESRPAAIYVTELKQDKNGNLHAISTKNVDFSAYGGLWVPCAGSRTPWNTHLGSEEYEPNAAKVKPNGSINPYYDAMADYYGGDLKKLNPYDYGWITEVKILNENGDVKASKHYAMGRFSHELAYVMPDKRTVYFGDDGTNTALFMFIADKPADLSSGTLYAAKWIQTSAKNGGSAKLKWISLGHATDSEVREALDKKYRFTDIFESIKPDGSTPPKGFSSIHASGGHEWLKIKPDMEKVASRLEARRYAAIKGATTEFRKMEGITYNSNKNELYVDISSIGKSMEDNMKKGKPNNKYDIGGNNDIRLPYNPCGGVYKLQLSNQFGSKYVAKDMKALVVGSTKGDTNKFNKCDLNSLANPDNISYMKNTDILLIGEDTGSGHQNDFVWAYNLGKNKLTRIETTPYGSETTSVYSYNNVNGHGYIMSVVQHPYGEGDAVTKEADMPKKAKNPNDMHAYTGYIGPLPVIK